MIWNIITALRFNSNDERFGSLIVPPAAPVEVQASAGKHGRYG